MVFYQLKAHRKPTCLIFLFCILLLLATTGLAFSELVKVGVYENKPLIYRDSQGEYQGFTLDVLRHIAEQENWQLQFVPGTWTECLQRLGQGEIDLQVAIAFSEQRQKLFSYPEQTLLTNWGRLYRHPTSKVGSLLDLGGKKVALLEKDIHSRVFLDLMDKFSMQVETVFVQDYDAVLTQVENGHAEVGVVNRMYAMQNAHRYRVETTPMIFNPIEVRYATPKRKNAQLRQAIDRHLLQLRQDKTSIYYQSLEKWFGQSPAARIPAWVTTTLSISALLLLMIIVISMLLKRQVKYKTSELNNVNQQLSEQIAQLQTTKNSLSVSEKKYRTLLETTSEGFWMIDRDLKTVAVNDSLCKMLMYPAEEIIGQTAFKFVDKKYRKLLLEKTAEIHTSDHRTYEVGMRRKDGSAIDLVFNGTTLRDESGELQGAFAFITDITEHKKADLRLAESEEKFRTLLNQQIDAVFLHRIQKEGFSKFSMVNDAAVERYGYSHDEFLQLTAADITSAEEIIRLTTGGGRKNLFEQGTAVFETQHRKKSGEHFPVEANARIIDLNGEKFILSTVRDITKRRNTELEQQLSNERFTTVLNSIDAGIYVADMDSYEILFMNQYLIDTFGQDFTGQICWDAFRKEPRICEHCTNELLVDEAGEPAGMQIWQGQNPVTGKHYMNHDRAIRWIDGRIVRLQISIDITETKTLEAQLRQKYKMEAVGLMAGGIAHDFNNVLAIIMTNLELMHRKMSESDPLLPRLEQAKSASLRASALVKQILTYSRQGEQDLKPIQLAFIIEESLRLLRSTTPTSIEILTQIDPAAQTEMVNADATQIEEVLINLSTNAIHAMGEKGLLTVTLARESLEAESLSTQANVREGEYLKLTVADTGRGMSQEVVEKIFDPFYTTKPAGQGTGMGLSISHGIVKKHNGYFTVDSQPGQGSTFSVYLPIVESERSMIPEIITDALPRGNERILLIDDEEFLASSVAELLIEHGYSVQIETNSVKALNLLKENTEQFDLIITDQTMPELTGMELAAELLATNPEKPIILCTGYSATMTEETALNMGIKAVFMKPLDLPALTQMIRTVLDGEEG